MRDRGGRPADVLARSQAPVVPVHVSAPKRNACRSTGPPSSIVLTGGTARVPAAPDDRSSLAQERPSGGGGLAKLVDSGVFVSSDYPPSVGSQEFDDDSVSMWQAMKPR